MRIEGGRRAGRTTTSLLLCVDLLLQGRSVVYVVPNASSIRSAKALAQSVLYNSGRKADRTSNDEIWVGDACLSFCVTNSLPRSLAGRSDEVIVPDHFAFEDLFNRSEDLRSQVPELKGEIRKLRESLAEERARTSLAWIRTRRLEEELLNSIPKSDVSKIFKIFETSLSSLSSFSKEMVKAIRKIRKKLDVSPQE